MEVITENGPPKPPPKKRNNIVIFSGGSAANTLVDVFDGVAKEKGCTLSYIIPISDNGGSSSELIRVFGGPGIGDVRSRLVRLIPSSGLSGSNGESLALKRFFNHRLPASTSLARVEWLEIVEGVHPLWSSISSPKRELIRSFLNTLNMEITKRARPSSVFNFQSASVGNLFLTGARLFTGSFEAAIYLLGSITGVTGADVIPAINSNFSHHICAGLRDGSSIVGQNAISHPTPAPPSPSTLSSSAPTPPNGEIGEGGRVSDMDIMTPTTSRAFLFPPSISTATNSPAAFLDGATDPDEMASHDLVEDANLPGSLPSLRKQNIDFVKTDTQELPSRIHRIYFINPYGQEIRPSPNPRVLTSLETAQAVIYSIGSLYTSIVPCLIPKGVGKAIADAGIRTKILILNGSLDRETGPSAQPFTASDFLCAIGNACASSSGRKKVLDGGLGQYVTHVIYLEGDGTPQVDKQDLRSKGVETVKVYGRKADGNGKGGAGGMRYDPRALGQALTAILGGVTERLGVGRRNTVQH